MRRDDLANKTEATNVSDFDPRHTGISSNAGLVNLSSVQINITSGFEDHKSTYQSSENSTGPAERRFYSSYDPEIGINTASVLGGLLLLLVIYVIYRTNCRKPILRVIHQCTMKYFPEEFMPEKKISSENVENTLDVADAAAVAAAAEAEWISESAKMIWQERAKYSQDTEFDKCCLPEQRKCDEGEGRECDAREKGNEELTNQPIDVDKDMAVNHLMLRLPVTEENVEKATAEWVQNVKHLDRKEQQLNGIILKIPPDLVSHNAKVRSYFNSVTDYCEADDFVSISSRNKSLPLLIEQQGLAQAYYANFNCVSKLGSSERRVDYAPLATQDEFDLGPRPSQLHVQHLSGSKVPLDICPIVKVQHFHSRSKRRLTSLNRTSSEESSNSSDGSGLPQAVPAGQTKYIRLHTEDLDTNPHHPDIKTAFQIKNNVQNNVAKKVPAGKYETRL